MIFTVDQLLISAKGIPASIDRELAPHIAKKCRINAADILSYKIVRRSIDARKKPDVKLLYRLDVKLKDNVRPLNASPAEPDTAEPDTAEQWKPENFAKWNPSLSEPVVVGSGPAGLFAALALSMAGYRPVIIERGYDVAKRKQDIDAFFRTRTLNPESNLLFGEGGAGTWSDGKLFTRIRDPRMDFAVSEFIRAGADENIAYFAHPHIGSDKLPGIIANIRKKIIDAGGRFLWGTQVKGVEIVNGKCGGVILNDNSVIAAPAVLIACGHSARELILNLINQGVEYRLKGFQIGSRIEHPQEFINKMQFGAAIPCPALGAAEYNMSSRPAGDGSTPGATTFCMCPGGEIIPATSDPEQLCTNGMSNSKRDGMYANSAIVTTVDPELFDDAEEAFDFLNKLEKESFILGGHDYTCPAQTAKAFIDGCFEKIPGNGSYSLGIAPARLDTIMPDSVVSALRRAVLHFNKSAPGFIDNGVFTGLETRVSSPVRFVRNPETLQSSVENLYIGGEGAGTAGGITSAAVDGLKLAEAILKNNTI